MLQKTLPVLDARNKLSRVEAWEGVRAGRFSSLLIPWCTYTQPEVAHVGLNPRDLEVCFFWAPLPPLFPQHWLLCEQRLCSMRLKHRLCVRPGLPLTPGRVTAGVICHCSCGSAEKLRHVASYLITWHLTSSFSCVSCFASHGKKFEVFFFQNSKFLVCTEAQNVLPGGMRLDDGGARHGGSRTRRTRRS